MSRTPLTDSMLVGAAASVLIAAAARLQDLSTAIERGGEVRELARTATHAVKLAGIAIRDITPTLRSLGKVRR